MFHVQRSIRVAILFASMWFVCALAQEQSDFKINIDDVLEGNYSREDVIQRFEEVPDPDPGFFVSSELVQQQNRVRKVVLFLPENAGGRVAQLVGIFRQGLFHGLEKLGVVLEVQLISTDGSNELEKFTELVKTSTDIDLIVGPFSHRASEQIIQKFPVAPVPVLLLQPHDHRRQASNYYSFSLATASEGEYWARWLRQSDFQQVILLVGNSGSANRMARAFENKWYQLDGPILQRQKIFGENEWKKIIGEYKFKSTQEDEVPVNTAVILAGDYDFTKQAKFYLPAGYKIFAAGAVYRDDNKSANKLLQGVVVSEIPWLADQLSEQVLFFDEVQIRSKSFLEQRFFAFGVDSALLISQADSWLKASRANISTHGYGISNLWQSSGVSADIIELECQRSYESNLSDNDNLNQLLPNCSFLRNFLHLEFSIDGPVLVNLTETNS